VTGLIGYFYCDTAVGAAGDSCYYTVLVFYLKLGSDVFVFRSQVPSRV